MKIDGFVEPGSPESGLLKLIDERRMPKHVAVIMDGNGRWAGLRKLPRVAGHRSGIDSVREIVRNSSNLGIEILTLYAFSVENWKRPRSEVRTLMSLLKRFIRKELDSIHANNVKFQTIGRIHELDESVRVELDHAIKITEKNTGMLLNVALNYSGRAELVDTFNHLLQQSKQAKNKTAITEELISQALYTSGLPDPDLLIRTSGEMRISNFLLWQIAYSEIYITPTFWPDFRLKHLLEAIVDYQKRDRRYGGV
jgi:undecaprenyl diphosphate synthase